MRRTSSGHRLRKPALTLVAVAALTGFLASSPTRVAAQPTGARQPNIVLLLPLSGDYGHLGAQTLESLMLVLNDSSGVAWTVLDTEGDATIARRLVVEAGTNPANLAILGPLGAAESRAAVEAAVEVGIPLLSLSSEVGIEHSGMEIFRLRVSPADQARQIARIAVDGLDMTRFAVLYPDDGFGRSAMGAFVDEILRSGGRITALEAYEPNETNLNEPVELLVSRRYRSLRGRPFSTPPRASLRRLSTESRVDFEAIFIPDYHERIGAILPFLTFWDVRVSERIQLLGISSWGGQGLRASEELIDGALFTQIFHPHMWDSSVARFVDRYVEAYGRLPSELEAQAYDALRFLFDVLNHPPLEGFTRTSLRRALLDAPPFRGLGSTVEIDPNGAIVRPLQLFSASRGGYVGPYQILR